MRKEFLIGHSGILVIWFLLTSSGLVGPLFLPPIPSLARELYSQVVLGGILPDIASTLCCVIAGFALGFLAGVPIGILMGLSKRLYTSTELVIDFFRSLPAMALFPLFVLFFGLGSRAQISIAFYTTFLFMVINTIYGVKSCKLIRIMAAKTMGASKLQLLTKVVLPSSFPGVFAGARVSISMALIVVVVSEMFLGSNLGLGQRIYNAGLLYRVPEMYATILITGVLGYVLNKAIVLLENRFIHWAGK